jgi:hypothetical protein
MGPKIVNFVKHGKWVATRDHPHHSYRADSQQYIALFKNVQHPVGAELLEKAKHCSTHGESAITA